MRPPNTHFIRNFNNRILQGNGKTIIDNDEIRNVQAELLDLLAYILQLENKISELEDNFNQANIVQVEMIGKDF